MRRYISQLFQLMGMALPDAEDGESELALNTLGIPLDAGLGLALTGGSSTPLGFSNILGVPTGTKDFRPIVVTVGPIANNASGYVKSLGLVRIKVQASIGLVSAGTYMTVLGSGAGVNAGRWRPVTPGERVLAQTVADVTSDASAPTVLARLFVNGSAGPNQLTAAILNTDFADGTVTANSQEVQTTSVPAIATAIAGSIVSLTPPSTQGASQCVLLNAWINPTGTLNALFRNFSGGDLAIPAGTYSLEVKRQ